MPDQTLVDTAVFSNFAKCEYKKNKHKNTNMAAGYDIVNEMVRQQVFKASCVQPLMHICVIVYLGGTGSIFFEHPHIVQMLLFRNKASF